MEEIILFWVLLHSEVLLGFESASDHFCGPAAGIPFNDRSTHFFQLRQIQPDRLVVQAVGDRHECAQELVNKGFTFVPVRRSRAWSCVFF